MFGWFERHGTLPINRKSSLPRLGSPNFGFGVVADVNVRGENRACQYISK
jgi:hypothetical protein